MDLADVYRTIIRRRAAAAGRGSNPCFPSGDQLDPEANLGPLPNNTIPGQACPAIALGLKRASGVPLLSGLNTVLESLTSGRYLQVCNNG